MKTVTASQLETARACPPQLKRFRQLFGESATVTVEAAAAVAGEFD